MRKTPTQRREELLDEIKDAIDQLLDIKSEKYRNEMATDLRDYLELNYRVRR